MELLTDRREPPSNASQKLLQVLEAALVQERFTDIVEHTGLAKSTVHRLVATLVEEGFLSGDAEHGYRAGTRFMSLAGRVLTETDITRVAQPVVDRLVAEVDCTVHVGVRAGDEMIYVIRTDSSKPYRMRSRIGLAIPMHSTGMGKAVMATWTDDQVNDYAERTGLPSRTAATVRDVGSLRSVLDVVRERGFALDLGENEDGTVCVAAAIHDSTGRATHGLSISSIALEHPGTSIEALAPQARAAAAEISRLLGARGV
ncbi:hypothetical protein A7K94_0201455 [Modestobacter sp. VKM Ac-2676]|nr:hypothetical protein A7K94_0201455 [Modestobacter sp. VKM Ac-2676]